MLWCSNGAVRAASEVKVDIVIIVIFFDVLVHILILVCVIIGSRCRILFGAFGGFGYRCRGRRGRRRFCCFIVIVAGMHGLVNGFVERDSCTSAYRSAKRSSSKFSGSVMVWMLKGLQANARVEALARLSPSQAAVLKRVSNGLNKGDY